MMFPQIKYAWKALWSRPAAPPTPVIYVRDSGPARWVQLLNYRDCVLALDTEGTIWKLSEEYGCSGYFITQIVQESPRRGWGLQ